MVRKGSLNVWVFFSVLMIGWECSAATITVTNFDGTDSNPITSANGSLLFRGTVWLGTFTTDDETIRRTAEAQDFQRLSDSFVQFGESVSLLSNGLPGIYQDVVTNAVTEGDAFAGQSVYTVVANLSVLSLASEFLIYKHDQVFLADPDRLLPALLNENEAGELILGDLGLFEITVGEIEEAKAFSLITPIPELSTLSLLWVASVWLSWNRRRM